MARNYDSTDLSWTWKGDISVDEAGDLSHNSEDALESIENEIINVVKSSKGDWISHPQLGADLWRFVGEANTRKNAEDIKEAVRIALIASGIVASQDIEVEVNALSLDTLYISVFLSAISTPSNRISSTENGSLLGNQFTKGIEVKFLFDTKTSAIYY